MTKKRLLSALAALTVSLALLASCSSKSDIIPFEDLPSEYHYEQAIENGDYVILDDAVKTPEAAKEFYGNYEKGKSAFMRSVTYFTFEDGLHFIVRDFEYKDKKITVTQNNFQQVYGTSSILINEYDYIRPVYFSGEQVGKPGMYYFATDLEEVTYENYIEGLAGEVIFIDAEAVSN